MSLFGDDEADFSKQSTSKSLFGEEAPAAEPANTLFADDDNTNGDSPWGMPTPQKKASRSEMIKNLLPPSDVPDSYIDAYDAILNFGHAQGGKISSEGLKKLVEGSNISQGEQARLLGLVATGGADAGLGRSKFNVFVALLGLAQEGEDATLDGVDERRSSKFLAQSNAVILKADSVTELPEPSLPYLDKLKTAKTIQPTAPQPEPPTPEQNKRASPASPKKSRQLRRDSLENPETDPWASSAARKYNTQPVQNEATLEQQTAMSRPITQSSGARTTSTFTTNSDAGDDDGNLPVSSSGNSAGVAGWGSGFANGVTGGLGGEGGFGGEEPSLPASRITRAVSSSAAAGTSPEETVTISVLPEKEGMFMFQHRNYEVKSARRASTVIRRYSDFVWLLDCLHKRYPFRQLPLLPPKKIAGESLETEWKLPSLTSSVVNGRHLSSDAGFIEKRRKGLVRFTNALVRHPNLSQEQLVVMFLTVPTVRRPKHM